MSVRLLARAFRIGAEDLGAEPPSVNNCEVLLIALKSDEGQHSIVWLTGKNSRIRAGSVAWQGGLGPLQNRENSSVLDRSWERIELFNRHGAPAAGNSEFAKLLDAVPRLSLDAVTDDSANDVIVWSWSEDKDEAAPYERKKNSASVLHKYDRSCLFIEAVKKGGTTELFLVANVRIRNLLNRIALGPDRRLDAMTWQFVVRLTRGGKLRPGDIWADAGPHAGDLRLRDVLCCADRQQDAGYSSFDHPEFGPLRKGFTLGEITIRRADDKPVYGQPWNALTFRVGEDPKLETRWIDELEARGLSKFPFEFPRPRGTQRGGLTFVADDLGTASLRFFARDARYQERAVGQFTIEKTEAFFVQDQVLQHDRSYHPRGRGRHEFVPWHVFAVRPPESRPKSIFDGNTPELSAASLVAWWKEKAVNPCVHGLRAVRDGVPLSLVPELVERVPTLTAWMSVVWVRDHVSNHAWHDAVTPRGTIPNFEVSRAMVQPAQWVRGAPTGLSVRLVGAATEDRTRLTVDVVLCPPAQLGAAEGSHWAFSDAGFAIDRTTVAFGLRLIPKEDPPGGAPKKQPKPMPIGALSVEVDASAVAEPEQWFGWKVACAVRGEIAEPEKAAELVAPEFRIQTRLPVRVRVGAVDRLLRDVLADVKRELVRPGLSGVHEVEDGFESEEPLVIELAPKAGDDERLLLVADEAVADGRDHNLRLQLLVRREPAADPPPRRIMVLDRTPFGVYLAQTPALTALKSAESGEVAIWESSGEGGAHWRLAELPQGVEVFLPPQGIGEAMEKSKRSDDPKEGPLDFRFTAHARLQIDPSFQDQRYGESPWNVRRLFGYAEQRSPGSRLIGFDVELLYGLTGRARKLGDVMVAEVESRLGRPAGRQSADLPWRPDGDQEADWQKYRRTWSRTREQLASRLGVLETYDLRGRELVIEEGLSWYQRGWKPITPTSDTREPGAVELAFPLEDYAVVRRERPGLANALFERKDGLAGGWTWGFTSLNLLEAVLRDPNATSGFLTGLKFSALGGWGRQKVSFDEDRTSIHADTSMGRTHFYSLERIGRISVFWNRAKHVIVFERTVAAADAFATEQDPQRGRPMLRKVREYVELLEPRRAFPDSDAPRASRGCVTGLNFPSKQIDVNSRWGEDVGDYGWKVPLWRAERDPERAELRPDPRPDRVPPQIEFALAADPEADVETILGRCSTPELLYFYTDTRKGTGADTDRWESIPGVDYGSASAFWVNERGDADRSDLRSSSEASEGLLPPEVAVPPGLHDFTFGISPLDRPVNLVADRAEGAINASLRNVTLMRSAEFTRATSQGGGSRTDRAREALHVGSSLYQEARRIEHELKEMVARGRSLADLKQQAKSYLADAKEGRLRFIAGAGALHERFKGFAGLEPCQVAREAAGAAFDRWSAIVERGLADARERLVHIIRTAERALAEKLTDADPRPHVVAARKALAETTGSVRSALAAALRAGAEGIVGVERAAESGVDQVEHEVRTILDAKVAAGLAALLDGVAAELGRLAAEFKKESAAIDPLFDRVAALRASARESLQRAHEGIEKIERSASSKGGKLGKLIKEKQLPSKLSAARGRLQRYAGTLDESLRWVLAQRPRAGELREEIERVLARAQGDLAAAKEAAVGTIEEVKAGIKDFRDAFDKQVDTAREFLSGALTTTLSSLDLLVSENDPSKSTFFKDLEQDLADVEGARNKLRAGEYATIPVQEELVRAEASWRSGAGDLRAGAVAKVESVCKAAQGELVEWLKGQIPAAAAVFDGILAGLDGLDELEELKDRLEGGANQIVNEATLAFEQVRVTLEASALGPVLQNPDRAIRLLRAFGDPPRLPNLDFNRAATAFVFGDPRDAVDITPVTGWFNRVGDDLKALGIRLPTAGLLDRLIPADLKDLDLGELLPDFAGLKLDRLFPHLRVPASLGEALKLTHGLDKQRQRAWVSAKIDLRLAQSSDLFSLGPLTLTLHRAHFDAVARIEAGLNGASERQLRGALTADWELKFGGQSLVTFQQTALRFDEGGHMRFDLSPDRIEFAPALRYLSDLARQLEYDEDGFAFRVLERNGLPYGAEALFSVALPPLQYGTTGIVGASIGAGLRLEAYPDFAISLQANVSRSYSPFVFSVFILGGSGHVDAKMSYLPFRNALTADVSIRLAASASLAFAFGVVCGQVAVALGVFVEYHRRPGQSGGGLGMGLYLQVIGRVEVKFLVSVHLSLELAAQYTPDGRITATGTLEIRVRISRFFKFTVSTTVAYDFRSGRTQSVTQRQTQYHPAVQGARKLAGASV